MTSRWFASFVLVCPLLGVSACASKEPGGDGEESGEDMNSGETGLASECQELLPEPAPATGVTFTVRNDRDAAIWIDPRLGCGSIPFWLLDPNGESRTWWAADCACPCEAVMTDPDEFCACPAACAQPALVRLDPGASLVEAWDARSLDPHSEHVFSFNTRMKPLRTMSPHW